MSDLLNLSQRGSHPLYGTPFVAHGTSPCPLRRISVNIVEIHYHQGILTVAPSKSITNEDMNKSRRYQQVSKDSGNSIETGSIRKGRVYMTNNKNVTKVRRVVLMVSDLNRSIKFYEEVIGLKTRKNEKNRAYLSPDGIRDLIILYQPENPEPAPAGSTGLFHIALLLPAREDLADLWLHLKEHSRWLAGASDHSVSEAIYLEDPDGNGIEIYADRKGVPVKEMGTERLQVEELLQHATGNPWKSIPKETVMGHIHLKVRDVPEAVEFYRDYLGFDLMAKMGNHAAFMSTGGYHHHIGLNSWNSLGGKKPGENATGLDRALIVVPDRNTLEAIKRRLVEGEKLIEDTQEPLIIEDPSGNTLQLVVEE